MASSPAVAAAPKGAGIPGVAAARAANAARVSGAAAVAAGGGEKGCGAGLNFPDGKSGKLDFFSVSEPVRKQFFGPEFDIFRF